MAWPKETDPEQNLRLEIKALLESRGLEIALPKDRVSPKIHVRVLEVEETRTAINHVDPETGKRCDWQNWEVTLDVVGDDRTPQGQLSKASSVLFAAFREDAWEERNEHGICTATLRKESNAQSEYGELKNPFIMKCDTITFIE
ncbi:hypothetical protein EON83_12580 [bacterium]|nr:MAG: hypothetical protein EON83_12580 [bacterium]